MAKMGLSVRDDPPKVVDLSLCVFGETQDGLALSIRQIPRDDRDALASVSVVIRNVGQEARRFFIPGWLAFYQFEVRLASGAPATLTPFGRALANPARKLERLEVVLAPGALHETEVPLGSVFSVKTGVATACCRPFEGVVVQSNEIVIG